MKTLNRKNLPWKQYWVIRNKNKLEKVDNKPQIGRWYRLRAIERERHCQLCRYQKTIEELKNCFCHCHGKPATDNFLPT